MPSAPRRLAGRAPRRRELRFAIRAEFALAAPGPMVLGRTGFTATAGFGCSASGVLSSRTGLIAAAGPAARGDPRVDGARVPAGSALPATTSSPSGAPKAGAARSPAGGRSRGRQPAWEPTAWPCSIVRRGPCGRLGNVSRHRIGPWLPRRGPASAAAALEQLGQRLKRRQRSACPQDHSLKQRAHALSSSR